MLVDDDAIAAFYAERIPADVHTFAAFERWRQRGGSARSRASAADARVPDAARGAARSPRSSFPRRSRWPAPRFAAQIPIRARRSAGWRDASPVPLPFVEPARWRGSPGSMPGMMRDKVDARIKALAEERAQSAGPSA